MRRGRIGSAGAVAWAPVPGRGGLGPGLRRGRIGSAGAVGGGSVPGGGDLGSGLRRSRIGGAGAVGGGSVPGRRGLGPGLRRSRIGGAGAVGGSSVPGCGRSRTSGIAPLPSHRFITGRRSWRGAVQAGVRRSNWGWIRTVVHKGPPFSDYRIWHSF